MSGSDPTGPKPDWPAYPDFADRQKELALASYEAEVRHATAAVDRSDALLKLDEETENELFKNLQMSIRSTAAGASQRPQALADLLLKAAGAIVTLYTGLLALVYAANGTALPLRALVPAVFLGLAVAGSMAYVAFLTDPDTTIFESRGGARENAWSQTRSFVRWMDGFVSTRAGALRAAVAALAVGIVLLPLPFLSVAAATGGTGDGGTTPVLEPWPSVPPTRARDADLVAIVYAAQVDEVAAIRTTQRGAAPGSSNDTGGGDTTVAVVAVVCGLAVVLLAATWPSRAGAPPAEPA